MAMNTLLLDVVDKRNGGRLLKTLHEVEVEDMSDHVMCAEYLAYWYTKKKLTRSGSCTPLTISQVAV